MATTQDKDKKELPKKKGGKDLDDLKKEVPIVSALLPTSCDLTRCHLTYFFTYLQYRTTIGGSQTPKMSFQMNTDSR